MRRSFILISILFLCVPLTAKRAPKRPPILGIAGVRIIVTDALAARDFYSRIVSEAGECDWCEKQHGAVFLVNARQGIIFHPLTREPHFSSSQPPASPSLIEEITFETSDVAELRRYLVFHKVSFNESKRPIGLYLSVLDPEGHRIGFVQCAPIMGLEANPKTQVATSLQIIHAGFVVHDRAAEDHFYKDILGFHVYWHGGMKDDQTDWVDMQVPDGTDWLEYMLNVPQNADHRTLGVMNHIALGVDDIHAAEAQLRKNGWSGDEKPKIGRDGKWQLNLYDPDLTRVELMEFKPVQKPCCAEYTGPHPR